MIFVVSLLGWFACFTIMAAEMRVPVNIPLGDLSRFWPATNVELTPEVENHHVQRP